MLLNLLTSYNNHKEHSADLLIPINDLRDDGCPYGELPGMWTELPPKESLKNVWEEKPFGHSMLPYISEPVELYGTRWQTLKAECQMKNLIGPFLSGSEAGTSKKPTRILVMGDSTGRRCKARQEPDRPQDL